MCYFSPVLIDNTGGMLIESPVNDALSVILSFLSHVFSVDFAILLAQTVRQSLRPGTVITG